MCEIQFVHKGLLAVRKTCGGHDVYNKFRSALELLEVHGEADRQGWGQRRGSRRCHGGSGSDVSVDLQAVYDWLSENGVKVRMVSYRPVLVSLGVECLLDLAALDEAGIDKVVCTKSSSEEEVAKRTAYLKSLPNGYLRESTMPGARAMWLVGSRSCVCKGVALPSGWRTRGLTRKWRI